MPPPQPHLSGFKAPMASALILALAAALIFSPSLRGHIDDVDAQLYQVVARHMVEDGTWLDFRYVKSGFREHLPFGLWPFAAAIRLWGESALGPLAAIFTLATIGVVGWVAHGLGGWSAGLSAMFLLAVNKVFFLYGGRSRLDPLLILLATAAAAPLLLPRIELRHWIGVGVLTTLAILVKGPFGLLPVMSALVARAGLERSLRLLLVGAGVLVLAVVPVTVFLLWEKWFGDATWWTKYVVHQLWGSATGQRSDGAVIAWYPLTLLYKEFLLGFLLILLGFWYAVRQKTDSIAHRDRLLMLTALCLFVLLGLSLPARYHLHHALLALPWLAVLAGVASGPLLERVLATPGRQRLMISTLATIAVIAWVAALAGKGPRFYTRPCVASTEFARIFDQISPGEDVWVVSRRPHWETVASLAAERRLRPRPTATLPLDRPSTNSPVKTRIALVAEDVLPQHHGDWQELGRARGWVLLRQP
jgi:4-amino-4-deoxy-L-arabinose transferase-like glycosyltransferase